MKNARKLFTVLFMVAAACLAPSTQAATPDPTWVYEITGTTTLRWTPPTQNVDGTALTDLDSYRIYFGLLSRNYTESIDVADGAAQNWSFSWPVADESQTNWFFAMTAIDIDANESGYSNEVQKLVTITITDSRPPMPPVLDEVETNWNCVVRDAAGAIVANASCDITVTDVP